MFNKLAKNERGSVAIETAFIVPILATMVLGSLEVSNIVSRQTELQTIASEAATIVIARPPEESNDRTALEGIIEDAAGLGADQVSLDVRFRCDTSDALLADASTCGTGSVVSEFIIIEMKDSYSPAWTQFGVGRDVTYSVTRRVQVS